VPIDQIDKAWDSAQFHSIVSPAWPRLQIVLIGDHQQLPPTVICGDKRSREILGRSLFERLVSLSGPGMCGVGQWQAARVCLADGKEP
jgi:hypothetical protein